MTTLPFSPGDRPRVRVALVGAPAEVPEIIGLLPRRWETTRQPHLARVPAAEVIVLGGATPALVWAARLTHPIAIIIAVAEPIAPMVTIARMLRAGADACVRVGTATALAGEVVAAHQLRRRSGVERSSLRLGAA